MPKLSMIDTHAHLDMTAFDKDRSEVIARARDAGVEKIISIGIDLESSQAAVRLAEKYTEVLATVGFHPSEANQMKEADVAGLSQLATHPTVVALGEMGLDFYRNLSSREAQLQALKWQLEVAARLNLPVIIHCRQAERDMLKLLRDWASQYPEPKEYPRGVIHCFSGDLDTARQYLDMGFFLSLGAYISYPSSRYAYNTIRSLPLDRLVVETDCPFLPPQSHRGQRNEPAYLPLTVQLLAEIREMAPEALADATTQNACHLFHLEHHG